MDETNEMPMDTKSVTVPMDMLPGCKVGDVYTVKSVADGNAVLDYAPGEGSEEDDWGKGLTAAMAGENQEGGM